MMTSTIHWTCKATEVDSSQRTQAERDPEKETMYIWRKMEAAVQDRAGWRQLSLWLMVQLKLESVTNK